jgi:hypothetical protein
VSRKAILDDLLELVQVRFSNSDTLAETWLLVSKAGQIEPALRIRIWDPESGAFLTTGSGMEENPDPGSVINISDHIAKSLVKHLWVENT